jgi:hypothetical protein
LPSSLTPLSLNRMDIPPSAPVPEKSIYMVSVSGDRKLQRVEAYGYTLENGKYFFHGKEDLSDRETFFLETKVKSIKKLPPPQEFLPVSISLG